MLATIFVGLPFNAGSHKIIDGMWAELIFVIGVTSGVNQAEIHQEKLFVEQATSLSGIRWEDRYEAPQGTFAYGFDREGSLVIVGWMTDSKRQWTVEDFTRWYLDERYAQVSSPKDLEHWEKHRRHLIGGFLDHKKRDRSIEFVSGNEFLSGKHVLFQARVREEPFVLKFY